MKKLQSLWIIALALTVLACQTQEPAQQAGIEEPAAVDADAIRAEITQATQQWAVASGAADADALTNLYTADARIYAPGMPPVSGHEEIRPMFTEMLSEGPFEVTLTTNDVLVSESGEMAVELGSFEDASGSGKYMAVWKNVDGEWKMAADTWNLNSTGETSAE